MCGIVGYWHAVDRPDAVVIERMAGRIESRGPDDFGIWIDSSAGLALGHRRLSIVDLSPAGHQPMTSQCGRYVLTFNGEIYNHLDLRRKLEREYGHSDWRGHSDTETLLAAFMYWGLEKALSRLNGMFAFALWDRQERTLSLARDRMGEKPLYYGLVKGCLVFGSELKALAVHPRWVGEVDRDSLALFFRYSFIPAPWSIYRGIKKVAAAHYVVIRNHGREIGEQRCYWELAKIAEQGVETALDHPDSATESFESVLNDAVQRRMVADVPLGAFLSGGYDSTLIVALMQEHGATPVRTFSIGFADVAYNEAHHAKAVSNYLGTDHTELYLSERDLLATVPRLPRIWDEPFSDPSQIPMYLVSQLARQHVTVSLSGDGGDELFFGYRHYERGYRHWQKVKRIPAAMRNMSKRFDELVGHDVHPGRVFSNIELSRFGVPAEKVRQALVTVDADDVYWYMVSKCKHPSKIAMGAIDVDLKLRQLKGCTCLQDMRDRMMYFDAMTYLPDGILTKVDRASMAVSLETRAPLLDHRLVELAWRIPFSYKFRTGQGKWLLREILYKYVPREMMERPKQGFGVPINEWLRGPLREWAESLLDEERLRHEGFLHAGYVRELWQAHVIGRVQAGRCLWAVLMFQAWLESQRNTGALAVHGSTLVSK